MRETSLALLLVSSLTPMILTGGDSVPTVLGCSNQTDVLAIPVRTITARLGVDADLQLDNFILREHRVPQKTCGLFHARYPVSVGILLDASGSMRASMLDNWAVAGAGVNQFLDISGPQDEYFLEYVDAGPAIQYAFTSDVDRVRAALQVSPSGPTALVDAIYFALNAMRKARHRTQALLVVSDAYDNQSAHTLQQLYRAFSESPVPLFLIVPTDNRYRLTHDSEQGAKRNALMRLAFETGGYAATVSSKKEMIAVATQVASAIRSVYTLYFVPPPSWNSGRRHDLRVEIKGVAPPRPEPLYRSIAGNPSAAR